MITTKHIKQSILILSFATLVAGCGGGSATTSTEAAGATSTPIIGIGATTATPDAKAVHQGQVKDSRTGTGLANVTVSLGNSNTTTDADGFYTLSDLTETKEAVINFEKEGYVLGSTQIQLKSLGEDNIPSPNYLEYSMHAHDKQWNYDSSEEIAGTHIAIDASVAYVTAEGNSYSGTVGAELTIFDTTTDKGKTLFPGTFKGINTDGAMVQFDSYGLIIISLKDSNGNRLHLADGETATLGFDAISSLEEQNTLPLWYYDYEQGLWVEEGYAELQADGSYKGEISHLGTWSLNRPLEDAPGTYRARIVFGDGTPARNIRIHAIGANWISSDLSTDEDGIFEIEVIPDSSFQLKAYDYKNKYGAASGTLAAIASGDVIEDRI